LRADPIGLAGGINLFAYVQNNPLNIKDLRGLIVEADPFGAIVPLPSFEPINVLVGVGFSLVPVSGPEGSVGMTFSQAM